MSKNLGILTNGRGKLGNVVLQRNNVQRYRQRIISNPRTDGQIIQRVIVSTASGMVSGLKGIVNHSFESIPYGQKSLNHFRKIALKALRQKAAEDLKKPISEQNGCFCPKGFSVCLPNAMTISEGSIPYDTEYNPIFEGQLGTDNYKLRMYKGQTHNVTGWSWEEFWWYFFGMRPGMQLTWLYFGITYTTKDQAPLYSAAPYNAEGGGYMNLNRQLWAPLVRVERLVLKKELSKQLLNPTTISDSAEFYDKLYNCIDWEKSTENSTWDNFITFEGSGYFDVVIDGNDLKITSYAPGADVTVEQDDRICAVASIRSEFDGGKWRRTTSPIVINTAQMPDIPNDSGPHQGLNISDAVESWLQAAGLGESNRFLNKGD